MSTGESARLRITLRTNEGTPATLRATDTIKISVQGRFDLNVPVNLDCGSAFASRPMIRFGGRL